MNRRLLHHFLDSYAADAAITAAASTPPSCGSSRWPTPTATTTPSPRATGCGARTCATTTATARSPASDGVDPNRNYPTRWGYDNEGSSPSPGSETYRGPAPGSEPETKALDGLMSRVDFKFQINYHSAAELLLYGVGWQVATPSPDDLIFEALAGDDANPAVPGYDPDIAAELYTTNGETDRARAQQVRHARVHPGDVDLRDGQRRRPGRRVRRRPTARASSTSRTPRR